MTGAPVDELVELLELEVLEVNLFRGFSREDNRQRVYGGQVAAQALMAAGRTVPDDRFVHSLHAYFLRPGDPLIPIVYDVDRIRDGGSFTTRRVVAIQHGQPIFHLSASFQIAETGLDHAEAMPEVPLPDALADGVGGMTGYEEFLNPGMVSLSGADGLLDLRVVGATPPEGTARSTRDFWLRTRGRLSDDPLLHACVTTYLSDLALIGTALARHPEAADTLKSMMRASLDHAVWFHRPCRADEWLLYHQTSPSAAGARGLSLGSLFQTDGTLVATVVQEGLIRQHRPAERSPAASR